MLEAMFYAVVAPTAVVALAVTLKGFIRQRLDWLDLLESIVMVPIGILIAIISIRERHYFVVGGVVFANLYLIRYRIK